MEDCRINMLLLGPKVPKPIFNLVVSFCPSSYRFLPKSLETSLENHIVFNMVFS